MLTITNKKGKVLKEVFVIRRVEVTKGEHAGRVIHIVRSVKLVKGKWEQNDYQVITFNDQDGRVTCGCPASGNCCHQDEAASYDMRRCNSIAPVQPNLLATVNTELTKVNAPVATPEEIAATQDSLLLPNNADQVAYFVQWNRRSAAISIKPVPTPTVRNVSPDWLLGRRNDGAFSGRVA